MTARLIEAAQRVLAEKLHDVAVKERNYANFKLGALEQENEKLRAALKWYVENDDTMQGGKWDESNAPWLEGKRRAQKLLGMEEE